MRRLEIFRCFTGVNSVSAHKQGKSKDCFLKNQYFLQEFLTARVFQPIYYERSILPYKGCIDQHFPSVMSKKRSYSGLLRYRMQAYFLFCRLEYFLLFIIIPPFGGSLFHQRINAAHTKQVPCSLQLSANGRLQGP